MQTHSEEAGGDRILVVVPTYNEAGNITSVTTRLRAAVPGADVLIADDDSPDGTGRIADELAESDERVHVLHRPGKRGLGAAYVAGFRWGIERGYDVLVEMDADGSHRPEELPRLLAALDAGADVALGSRWVEGGSVVNWPRSRQWLSRGGSAYSRWLLGLPHRDVTGGYRALRTRVVAGLGLDAIRSQGYCFQIDLLRRASAREASIVEVPITFVEREIGTSKMNRAIVAEAVWRVAVWGTLRRLSRPASAGRGRKDAVSRGPGGPRRP
ncbi:polyprenol monophosphomannose synthase [Streptomyces montanisoli]|uniref:Polyprenol monophosphomannose synthase n=1 Tax=Streptomyces montanisoli TaxID=2798581 RepID=A0A940M611_9ACTN|nr:polyprenol monophosphomannose synthase [Streptomyces montanisoli]MBP0456810.1 polyprenol monophosphomannose synthase [Streptomyces montanisoli]